MNIHYVINTICILMFVFASCVLTTAIVKTKSIKLMEQMIEDISRLGGYAYTKTDDGKFERRELTSSELKKGITDLIKIYMRRL